MRTILYGIALLLLGLAVATPAATAMPDTGGITSSPSYQCYKLDGRTVCVAVLQGDCAVGIVYTGMGGCHVPNPTGSQARLE